MSISSVLNNYCITGTIQKKCVDFLLIAENVELSEAAFLDPVVVTNIIPAKFNQLNGYNREV